MANKTATVKLGITYTGPSGESLSLPTKTVLCPYETSLVTALDIPAATPAGDFDVPFGTLDVDVTCALLVNETGQEINISLNGGAPAYTLPDGCFVMLKAATAIASDTPLTSIKVTLTDTQGEAGSVGCYLFGDPV